MFKTRFKELASTISSCSYTQFHEEISPEQALALMHGFLFRVRKNQGIVYVIGNGGSAGIASHFSNDLMKALQIPSQTFYDSNLLTCLANDIGYENVFSYPLQQLLKTDDLLVAISSSGQSKNILNAAELAHEKNASLVTLSGFSQTNPLRLKGDLNFWVDSKDYGLVETSHFFLLHTVVDCWNKKASNEIRVLKQLSR